jgi:hypothetical protein
VGRFFEPWVTSGTALASQSSTSCPITQGSAIVCGELVTVSPFVAPPAGTIGGTFTSQSGTGASTTITITFAAAVDTVTTTIHDPTFSGNMMIAYDSGGAQIGSVSFTFSGTPGDNQPDTETVVAHGIRRIDLVPANADYVSYDVSFVNGVCPPDGDPLMDSAAVRSQIANIFQQSGAGGPDSTFHEIIVAVYKNADGSISVLQPPQTGTTCNVTATLPAPGILDPNLLGLIHVHNVGTGHPSTCPGAGLGPDPADRGFTDGLSTNDMMGDLAVHAARKAAGLPDISDDVVDLDRIWRNNPSAPPAQRNTSVPRVPANCRYS